MVITPSSHDASSYGLQLELRELLKAGHYTQVPGHSAHAHSLGLIVATNNLSEFKRGRNLAVENWIV